MCCMPTECSMHPDNADEDKGATGLTQAALVSRALIASFFMQVKLVGEGSAFE